MDDNITDIDSMINTDSFINFNTVQNIDSVQEIISESPKNDEITFEHENENMKEIDQSESSSNLAVIIAEISAGNTVLSTVSPNPSIVSNQESYEIEPMLNTENQEDNLVQNINCGTQTMSREDEACTDEFLQVNQLVEITAQTISNETIDTSNQVCTIDTISKVIEHINNDEAIDVTFKDNETIDTTIKEPHANETISNDPEEINNNETLNKNQTDSAVISASEESMSINSFISSKDLYVRFKEVKITRITQVTTTFIFRETLSSQDNKELDCILETTKKEKEIMNEKTTCRVLTPKQYLNENKEYLIKISQNETVPSKTTLKAKQINKKQYGRRSVSEIKRPTVRNLNQNIDKLKKITQFYDETSDDEENYFVAKRYKVAVKTPQHRVNTRLNSSLKKPEGIVTRSGKVIDTSFSSYISTPSSTDSSIYSNEMAAEKRLTRSVKRIESLSNYSPSSSSTVVSSKKREVPTSSLSDSNALNQDTEISSVSVNNFKQNSKNRKSANLFDFNKCKIKLTSPKKVNKLPETKECSVRLKRLSVNDYKLIKKTKVQEKKITAPVNQRPKRNRKT